MNTYDKIQEELDGLLDNFEEEDEELHYSFASLMELKKADLVDLCKQHELPTSGNKKDLVDRIMEATLDSDVDVISAKSTITFTSEDKEKEQVVSAKAERV